MSGCTAPVYGHRTASGAANCPVCRYRSSYRPSYSYSPPATQYRGGGGTSYGGGGSSSGGGGTSRRTRSGGTASYTSSEWRTFEPLARQAEVVLRAHDGGLSVSVTDDGRGAASGSRDGAGGSNGLRGLQERLVSCGGRLASGPVESGCWSVVAWVPTANGPVAAPAPPARLQTSPV